MTCAPGFAACIFITFLIFYITKKFTPPQDRSYVLKIIAAALVFRLIALIAVQHFCQSSGLVDIFGDAADNLIRGNTIGDYLSGRADLPVKFDFRFGTYNMHLLTYAYGIFFGFFRYEFFSAKCINIMSMAVLGLLIYDFSTSIYNSSAGRVALSITLFWPTIFFWSITGLKEIYIILSITGLLWSINKIISSKSVKMRLFFFFILIFFSYCFILLRTQNREILLAYFGVLFIYFVFRKIIKRSKYKIIGILFLLLILCIIMFLFKEKIYHFVITMYRGAVALNRGFINSGGINYDVIAAHKDIFTAKFFVMYLFLSCFHFLMEPLPGNIISFNLLFMYPIVLCWYLIWILAIVGAIKVYKIGNFHKIIPLTLFLIIYIISLSVVIANIGTAIRMRDNIAPLVIMLASCGIVSFFKPKVYN